VSYHHGYEVARAHGEAGPTTRLVPLTVDGLTVHPYETGAGPRPVDPRWRCPGEAAVASYEHGYEVVRARRDLPVPGLALVGSGAAP
jgi:hypothetical protein